MVRFWITMCSYVASKHENVNVVIVILCFTQFIWYSIHCYHDWEVIEPENTGLNKFIAHMEPFEGQILDHHVQQVCGFKAWKCECGDSIFLFHPIYLIQHSLLSWLGSHRAWEHRIKQIYRKHGAIWSSDFGSPCAAMWLQSMKMWMWW